MPSIATLFVIAISGTVFCTLIFFTPLWGPSLLFRKLGAPTKPTRPVPAFSLTDVLVLLALLSLVNAALAQMPFDISDSWRVFLFTGANSILALTWLLGLRQMESHAIQQQSSRLMFQLALHPLAIFGPAGIIAGSFILFGTVSEPEFGHVWTRPKASFYMASLLLITTSLGLCYLARRDFAWLISRESPRKP
jgi:hypothetical protein